MTKELSDFFKLISEEKHKKNKEIKKDKKILQQFENFIYSEKIESEFEESDDEAINYIESNDPPSLLSNDSNLLIEKSLGLLSEPSNSKQKNDPITPLNANFATHEDLQKHYKLFLERIQQQLSTLGGGGETNLTFMDVPITSVTTSTYNITPRDYYIGVNYTGAVTIKLPKADRQGKIFIVKDELGEASRGSNRYITILPSGSDLIDGRDRAILAYDYGSLTFIWKGNSWRII